MFFHFPDSSPSVLNGLDFYFSLRDSASRELIILIIYRNKQKIPRTTESGPFPIAESRRSVKPLFLKRKIYHHHHHHYHHYHHQQY